MGLTPAEQLAHYALQIVRICNDAMASSPDQEPFSEDALMFLNNKVVPFLDQFKPSEIKGEDLKTTREAASNVFGAARLLKESKIAPEHDGLLMRLFTKIRHIHTGAIRAIQAPQQISLTFDQQEQTLELEQ